MKKIKSFAMGFTLGVAVMITSNVIAANITKVEAFIPQDVTFKIDGKVVAQDPNLPALNYKDSTYVPIRFISENMGATVGWDVVKRQVSVDLPKPEPEVVEVIKEVEKIVYVDSEDAVDGNKVYKDLPITINKGTYIISLNGISRSQVDNKTRLYIKLENTGDTKIQLNQSDAKLTVDGKEYGMTKVFGDWDQKWYNDINRNDSYDGTLVMELIPEDYKYCTLTVPVRINGSASDKEEIITFNFKK